MKNRTDLQHKRIVAPGERSHIFLGGIMYEHPFTIKEVAIIALAGDQYSEFPGECPHKKQTAKTFPFPGGQWREICLSL